MFRSDPVFHSVAVMVMDHETAGDSCRSREAASVSIDSSVLKSSESPIDSFVVVVVREEDDGNSSVTDLEKKVSSDSNLTPDPCSVSDSLELKIESADEEKNAGDLKESKTSCVIDLDLTPKEEEHEKIGEYSGGERVCRICHLNSDQSNEMMTTRAGLIELGCGCKDELGIAHGHCAESWFKIRGIRQCEICGETAKNVMGVGDYRFMEAWNQAGAQGGEGGGGSNAGGVSDGSDRGCCGRQPFCNFLMGCLVIAFVLPWFFRVNTF